MNAANGLSVEQSRLRKETSDEKRPYGRGFPISIVLLKRGSGYAKGSQWGSQWGSLWKTLYEALSEALCERPSMRPSVKSTLYEHCSRIHSNAFRHSETNALVRMHWSVTECHGQSKDNINFKFKMCALGPSKLMILIFKRKLNMPIDSSLWAFAVFELLVDVLVGLLVDPLRGSLVVTLVDPLVVDCSADDGTLMARRTL